MEDKTIAKVIQLNREGTELTTSEKCKESKEVRMLLSDMEKLTLTDDGVLCRPYTDKQQLAILKKRIPLVFTELHVKMGHLGNGLHCNW